MLLGGGFMYKRGRSVVALNRNLLEEKMTFSVSNYLGLVLWFDFVVI